MILRTLAQQVATREEAVVVSRKRRRWKAIGSLAEIGLALGARMALEDTTIRAI